MLTITIPKSDMYDESTNSFLQVGGKTIALEHSLISISKWESKWHKAFLSKADKSFVEIVDYIKCMCVTKDVSDETYLGLTQDNVNAVNEYINDPMTATRITKSAGGSDNGGAMTSEVIYYLMVTYNIPFECQKWHLSRLMTLIQVCEEKNKPSRKMSKQEIAAQNRSLNAARRRANHSRG